MGILAQHHFYRNDAEATWTTTTSSGPKYASNAPSVLTSTKQDQPLQASVLDTKRQKPLILETPPPTNYSGGNVPLHRGAGGDVGLVF